MRRVAILAAWVASATAQTPDLSQLELMERIKIRAAENLAAQPNYTCHETIERSVRPPGAGAFRLRDTVQLEVALIKGHELFSRRGADHFEDAMITDLVTDGTIANGNFALHARAVFLGAGAVFQYRGMAKIGGRTSHAFDYTVQRAQSGWEIKVDNERGFVGYKGSFHVDAVTLDLEDFSVETLDIPPNLRLRAARDLMEYQRVSLGNSEFLLPRSSEMVVIALNGIESRNRTLFHACRQYAGETLLKFDEAPILPTN